MSLRKERLLYPKWVRLKSGAQQKLNKEYLNSFENGASEKYLWFLDLVDYQESCDRTSRFQTLKTRAIRLLLFLAEKVAAL